MKGLLVRVGIDSTDGNWNAPARRSSGEFAFVTITENPERTARPRLARLFDEFSSAVRPFGVEVPSSLLGLPTHLDPDFDHLTYGDRGSRGRRIEALGPGDFLAFFAGLRAIEKPGELIYALIGIYIIDEKVPAHSVTSDRWRENAHTRRPPEPDEIVIRGRPTISGRLRRFIPIGEYRDRAYRVRRDLLEAWGDLDITDGYIQRSVRLPAFRDAPKFYKWFLAQEPQLTAANNPL